MVAEVKAALVLVVFAGGPDTGARYELMQRLLAFHQPECVFLTGADFLGPEFSSPASSPVVVKDPSRTTLESCMFVSRDVRCRFPDGARVLVVTSNYHAPRVRWLLRGLLSDKYGLEFEVSRDIVVRDLPRQRKARVLIVGEIISWVYCFPVGLAFRPFSTGVALLLAAAVVKAYRVFSRRRRRD